MKALLAIALAATAAATAHANYRDWCRWEDLELRLGAGNVPTGLDVFGAMVESEDANGDYAPDACTPFGCDPEFDGPTIITHKSGASDVSFHAALVGRRFLGQDGGLAPNLKQIQCYELTDWFNDGCLNVGQSGQPPTISGAVKVWNHSWVGDTGSSASNIEAHRRLDWIVAHHATDPIVCVGINNGPDPEPLLADAFNVITVGRRDGDHAWGTVQSPADGVGRMRPDIIGPQFTTSEAAGVISGAAAMLVDTALTDPLLPDSAKASEVLKAVLMAGANHTGQIDGTGDNWSNEAPQDGPSRGRTSSPLDPVVGAGHLDIDRTHRILTAGQQPGALDPLSPADAESIGWSLESIGGGETMQWRFRSLGFTDEFTILATWHRTVESDFSKGSLANFDLSLLRMSDGVAVGLVGDAGLSRFEEGNVVSDSLVDNVEHLYIRGLQPGHYVLSVLRRDTDETPVDLAIAWWTNGEIMNADLDDNGEVGVGDLLTMFEQWGTCSDGCDADLDGNGVLDLEDLLALIERWGA